MKLPEYWKGLLYIVAADLMWGLSGTVAKHLFNNRVSPMDLTQLRLVISVIVLVLYLKLFNRSLLKVEREDFFYFLIFGVFGVAAVQFAYLNTISLTNVATAVFLEYLAPAFVLFYGVVFKKESVTLTNMFALVFAKGLESMSPVKTGIISTMEPVMAGIFAYLILGETLSFLQIAGCLLVLVAVVVIHLAAVRPLRI